MRVFEFVHAEKANHKIAVMCRVLDVSKSGYHAWVDRPPSQRSIDDTKITAAIEPVWERSRRTYGAPRVHVELRLDHDIRCGRKRVARLMRKAGIEGVHRRRRRGLTRRDLGAVPPSDLVERDFRPHAPDRFWVADITQQWTGEGWLYVAVVIDAFSRRVVGWAMDNHLRTELVLDARRRARAPLRSWLSIHQPRVRSPTTRSRHRRFHGQRRRLLRQRRRRELLRDTQDRSALPPLADNSSRNNDRDLRLHRSVLQPASTTLDARLPQPNRL